MTGAIKEMVGHSNFRSSHQWPRPRQASQYDDGVLFVDLWFLCRKSSQSEIGSEKPSYAAAAVASSGCFSARDARGVKIVCIYSSTLTWNQTKSGITHAVGVRKTRKTDKEVGVQ